VNKEVSFSSRLIAWQQQHGRHDLPWQGVDAYGVWLSEIMLQQTQVATVLPYYQRFLASFPDINSLAAASEDEVLALWSGLGYYARGRNLHRTARIILEQYGGEFPRQFDQIVELPGIGRSTAAAICALAYHERRAILDGNVKRVLARYCGIAGWAGNKKIEERLWRQAEALLPEQNIAPYIQGLMDLGATLCTASKPMCAGCPVQTDCVAFTTDRISELPAPRPKKVIPERGAVMLLLVHGSDILLEKRPPHGIWGGLWSLPQFDSEAAAKVWFEQTGMAAGAGERLTSFNHTFTHFKLNITPLQIQLAQMPRQTPAGSTWLSIDDAPGAALPTPVRKILGKLAR
jgi:A/G-specific adenine glycosylase